MITPRFDFRYGGKPFREYSPVVKKDGNVTRYELPDRLYAELHAEYFPAYNAVSWVVYYGNDGDRDSLTLSEIRDCAVDVPVSPDPPRHPGSYPTEDYALVSSATGMVNYDHTQNAENEFRFLDYPLMNGQKLTRAPQGGRSATGTFPFFEINHGQTGVLTAVGWTGQWKAVFTRGEDFIKVETGVEDAEFYLKPGERIRAASTLMLEYENGRNNAYNNFRRLVKNELAPFGKGEVPPLPPMSFECFGGMPTETMKKRLNALSEHGVRFDHLWIDAGWYGSSEKNCADPFTGDWGSYTGDWYVNRNVHPEGLQDVRRLAGENGMKMLVWFEPERALRNTKLFREHPDWFIDDPDCWSVLLDLSKEEALDGIYKVLSGMIEELGVSCYRQDFNIDPLPLWRFNDEPGRRGITEIRYIANLYRLWDRLHERFPSLIFDDCAGGGRRIDIEMLRRSVPIWRTDYYCNLRADPDIIQAQSFGVGRFVPYSGGVTKRISDTYAARSTYAAAWVGAYWCYGFMDADNADIEWAKKISDEYLSLREYFSCDFYPVENPGATHAAWCASRYDRPENGDGIVMIFKREESNCTDAGYNLGMTGEYIFTDIDSGESFVVTDGKLHVNMPEKRSSKILRYRIKAGKE